MRTLKWCRLRTVVLRGGFSFMCTTARKGCLRARSSLAAALSPAVLAGGDQRRKDGFMARITWLMYIHGFGFDDG